MLSRNSYTKTIILISVALIILITIVVIAALGKNKNQESPKSSDNNISQNSMVGDNDTSTEDTEQPESTKLTQQAKPETSQPLAISQTQPANNNNPNSTTAQNQQPENIPKINSDKQFLLNIIPHHQEEVDVSKQFLASTTDPELTLFAQRIVDVRTKEINQMKQWYKDWYGADYIVNTNYKPEIVWQQGKRGIESDKKYAEAMITHYSSAIDMATQIKNISQKNQLLRLVDTIINSQTQETNLLQDWLISKEA